MTFTRYYEFMSQIVDYESTDLETLSLYARHLAPLLRETRPDEDPIDLGKLQAANLLFKVVQKVAATDLSPAASLAGLLVEDIRGLPGVTHAAVADGFPLDAVRRYRGVTTDQDVQGVVHVTRVGPDTSTPSACRCSAGEGSRIRTRRAHRSSPW